MDWPPTTTILVALLAVVIVFALLTAWHYRFWVRRLGQPVEYAERHDLRMPDGLPISLHRLAPPDDPRTPPVLLVHGIASDHRNVDEREDRSLARHLHARGRDVWLLTLRSGQPGLSLRERARVDFRSMVDHDLPRAIAFVLAQTQRPALDYVGFSMGGILLYAALGRSLASASLRRVATIGSPARVAPPIRALRVLGFLPRVVFRVVWLRMFARMGAFAVDALATPLHRQVYNPHNVEPGAAGGALVNLIQDVPAPLSADFAKWALGDGVIRVDGEDILAGLGEVEVPALFIAGAVDNIARPEAVRAAFEAWGRERDAVDKRFVVLGREQGCAQDYGHGDLAIGERVEAELFTPLADFLDATADMVGSTHDRRGSGSQAQGPATP